MVRILRCGGVIFWVSAVRRGSITPSSSNVGTVFDDWGCSGSGTAWGDAERDVDASEGDGIGTVGDIVNEKIFERKTGFLKGR